MKLQEARSTVQACETYNMSEKSMACMCVCVYGKGVAAVRACVG